MSDDNLLFSNNSKIGKDSLNEIFKRNNPLSIFSSYTYIITLYMMTPECANAFANTGILPNNNDNTKYIIIAQSGGINNQDEARGLTDTTEFGPNKTGLNFYIDDLNILTYLMGQDRQRTATISTEFNFNIVEPIGFTFITKLSKASVLLNSYSRLVSQQQLPTMYQQHYAIGIKFYGYDSEGNILKTVDVPDSNIAVNDSNGLYERIFPIIVKKLNFKLTGRSTVYHFESVLQHTQSALSIKRGYVSTQTTLEGANVGDILGDTAPNKKSLINWLNNTQKDLKNKNYIDIPNTYKIEWIDNQFFKSSQIKNSPLITDAEYNPATTTMNKANTTSESNAKLSIKNGTIDTINKIVTVPANTPIVTLIDQIISKSNFVKDKLISKINEKIESEIEQESKGKFLWYHIHPITKIIDRDPKLNDWVYDVTYQVIPYEVPYVKTPYAGIKSKYYGPVKKYSYLFTGENSEIISFDMEFDNLYYMVISPSTVKNNVTLNNQGPSPLATVGSVDDNSSMIMLNKGGSILENVRANLYSPADNVIANMKILGDPDFLMSSIGINFSENLLNKFSSNNGSLNPYAGQMFIEINFKVAEDYNLDNGLLDVDATENVGFYPEKDQQILGNRGIIYKINSVKSNFSKGKFEQDLEMFMVHPSELILTYDNTSTAFNKDDQSYYNKEVARFSRPNNENLNTQSKATTRTTNPSETTIEEDQSYYNKEVARFSRIDTNKNNNVSINDDANLSNPLSNPYGSINY